MIEHLFTALALVSVIAALWAFFHPVYAVAAESYLQCRADGVSLRDTVIHMLKQL